MLKQHMAGLALDAVATRGDTRPVAVLHRHILHLLAVLQPHNVSTILAFVAIGLKVIIGLSPLDKS